MNRVRNPVNPQSLYFMEILFLKGMNNILTELSAFDFVTYSIIPQGNFEGEKLRYRYFNHFDYDSLSNPLKQELLKFAYLKELEHLESSKQVDDLNLVKLYNQGILPYLVGSIYLDRDCNAYLSKRRGKDDNITLDDIGIAGLERIFKENNPNINKFIWV